MISKDKKRNKTRVAVYLLGIKNNKILLGKRKNTQHMNNYWSLFAGHVFEGESCSNALKRECLEECGVYIKEQEFNIIGAMHHKSGEFDYINYIFKVDLSNHNPLNSEPEKCSELNFFDISNLPNPIDDYIKLIITKSFNSKAPWIIEYGW